MAAAGAAAVEAEVAAVAAEGEAAAERVSLSLERGAMLHSGTAPHCGSATAALPTAPARVAREEGQGTPCETATRLGAGQSSLGGALELLHARELGWKAVRMAGRAVWGRRQAGEGGVAAA